MVGEEAKVLLQFLINSLGLSISLGVISGGEGRVDSKEFIKRLRKVGRELGTSIGYNLLGKAMVAPNVITEQSCSSFCREIVTGGDEVCSFCESVDDDKDGGVTMRGRKLSDEISSDLFPWGRRRGNGVQSTSWF